MRKPEEFEFVFAQPEAVPARRKSGDAPMRIVILADLSGRKSRGIERAGDLDARPVAKVDVDSFDDALYRFAPQLNVAPAGTVTFNNLDDFHPDALFDRLELFQGLRSSRDRLIDPATFAAEAGKLVDATRDASAQENSEDDDATLSRLLGRPSSDVAASGGTGAAATEGVDAMIRRVVAPHVVAAADPRQTELVASVDRAIGDQMRRTLQHPAFRGLEATWRSIHRLVTTLDLDERLELRLVDVTKAELTAALASSAAADSPLERLLEPLECSILVGDITFSATADDLTLLARLGSVARRLGAAFLSSADLALLGCSSIDAAADPSAWSLDPAAAGLWQRLRASAVAGWIGLAVPRLLVRLPYGKRVDEIERFDFDELSPGRGHEEFLWGNPAYGCAWLLAAAFLENGWGMEPGDCLQLDDLPVYSVVERGESQLTPCAEAWLGERAVEAVLESGPMPLLSVRGAGSVRVARFQSVAAPAAALQGSWG